MFVELTEEQKKQKINYIKNYIKSNNAADGSQLDANANIVNKNIATLEHEINKDINIQINRSLVAKKIKELYGEGLSNEYIRQIESHEIYVHDETSLKPYCASISMYPFLLEGLKTLGGESGPPKHLQSFCGGFVNLVFAVASQFAGAVATVEFLMYFDYFAKKDLGENYLESNSKLVKNLLEHIVYSINQPASARGYQSVFWNISIYDKHYFESMFGNFSFPDMTKPTWKSVNKMQKFFMRWFNEERTKSVLSYPIVTAACLTKNNKMIDKDFEDFIAEELSEGNSFFIYMSENANTLSSCCRLKNNIEDSINDFSYTLGAGGVSTGSINVISLNINRIIQKKINLQDIVEKVQKYQIAYRKIIEEYKEKKMLPCYDAGFIALDRQYLTIGINGLVEAAEFLGYTISINDEYTQFVEGILTTINQANQLMNKKTGYKFNTEFVPAENLGVKNAKWDKKDGLKVSRNCYNSYLYKVEDENISVLDKFTLQGRQFIQYLDGGSAYHCNLEDYPTKESFKKLFEIAAKEGCEYFCFNIKVTICKDCNYIDKRTYQVCQKCKSKNCEYATRVIGYLRPVKSFSSDRQYEELQRSYTKSNRIKL